MTSIIPLTPLDSNTTQTQDFGGFLSDTAAGLSEPHEPSSHDTNSDVPAANELADTTHHEPSEPTHQGDHVRSTEALLLEPGWLRRTRNHLRHVRKGAGAALAIGVFAVTGGLPAFAHHSLTNDRQSPSEPEAGAPSADTVDTAPPEEPVVAESSPRIGEGYNPSSETSSEPAPTPSFLIEDAIGQRRVVYDMRTDQDANTLAAAILYNTFLAAQTNNPELAELVGQDAVEEGQNFLSTHPILGRINIPRSDNDQPTITRQVDENGHVVLSGHFSLNIPDLHTMRRAGSKFAVRIVTTNGPTAHPILIEIVENPLS